MTGTESENSAAQPRRPYLQWVSLLLSALLLVGGGLLVYSHVDSGQILKILLKLDVKWLIAAIAVYWLLYPLTAYRFRYIYRWLKPADVQFKLPTWLILKVTFSSGFVSVAAPVGLVADFAKIGAFRVFGGLSTTFATRCILFDRAIAAQWMAILALASFLPQWLMGVPLKLILIQAAAGAVVVVGVCVLLVLPKVLGIFRHDLIARISFLFTGYIHMMQPRRLFVQFVFALASAFLSWATLYCLLRAGGLSADLWLVAYFLPFLQLINSVPFLYMGWGGREIAMAATLGTVSGLTLNQALAVSAAWGVVLIVAGVVNAVFLIGDWSSHRERAKKVPKLRG